MQIGDKFGEWIVINDIPQIRTSSQKYYECKCKCGTIKWLHGSSLIGGQTLMCKTCSRFARRKIPILNKKYKSFTVVSIVPTMGRAGNLRYETHCECGSIVLLTISQLEDNTRYFSCKKCNNKSKNTQQGLKVGDISQSRYYKLKIAAERRNYSFNISKQYLWDLYLKQNGKCALTGESIFLISTKDGNASLDRIDSNVGYEEGNVQWITKEANICKNKLSQNDFLMLCQKVINHANQQPSTPLTKCEGSETNS